METGLHWGLTYRTGEPSINDSHLHSIMKTRYKHHPYQYAPQVLEKALMLNLILYIPISEEQFTLIEGKKVHDFLFDFLQKNLLWKINQKTQNTHNNKICHLLFILKFSNTWYKFNIIISVLSFCVQFFLSNAIEKIFYSSHRWMFFCYCFKYVICLYISLFFRQADALKASITGKKGFYYQ